MRKLNNKVAEEKSPSELPQMGFWSHVDALRAVLIRGVIVIAVLTVVLFIYMPDIFDTVILAPCHGDFILYRLFEKVTHAWPWLPEFTTEGFDVKLINIQLASQFFIHMSTSAWLAIVLGMPILLYLLWGFVSPALYPREKRGVRRAFALGSLMFYLGVAVGYFIVFPVTLRFLAEYQISAQVPNQISLDSYMDNLLTLILVMGLVFELPLIAWMLGSIGLLNRRLFNRYRRHAIVFLLILAAFITPTGDPFTLMIVFLPIYLLWEASAFLVPPAPAADNNE
ncbi:MAG: twin-arginine translocase subunit TatC [Muribaculaceae bacterium]|nr:twin-arginine translocase subunit TatC [Muribaculaceae bacterium]